MTTSFVNCIYQYHKEINGNPNKNNPTKDMKLKDVIRYPECKE